MMCPAKPATFVLGLLLGSQAAMAQTAPPRKTVQEILAAEFFVNSSELLLSEAHCDQDVIDSVLDEAQVKDSRPGRATLVAQLSSEGFANAGCSLRVRVRDKAHNTSPWFLTKRIK